MSLSSFWEWEKDLTLGVFNHFTSKHHTLICFNLLCTAVQESIIWQMDWTRSLLTRATQGRSPCLALQIHPWGAPALSAGPIRSVKHSLYSMAPSLGKSCKGKGQVLPDFKSIAMQLRHWEGKTPSARSLLLSAYLIALLYIFTEFPPGTEVIWSTLEIL